nr:MAG TPA: hypothetical protein [Caudoviricetes sp.]
MAPINATLNPAPIVNPPSMHHRHYIGNGHIKNIPYIDNLNIANASVGVPRLLKQCFSVNVFSHCRPLIKANTSAEFGFLFRCFVRLCLGAKLITHYFPIIIIAYLKIITIIVNRLVPRAIFTAYHGSHICRLHIRKHPFRVCHRGVLFGYFQGGQLGNRRSPVNVFSHFLHLLSLSHMHNKNHPAL